MQAVFVDVPFSSPAIPASAQGNAAGSFLRAVEFDVLCFLYWLLVQLCECFSVVAGSHGLVNLYSQLLDKSNRFVLGYLLFFTY